MADKIKLESGLWSEENEFKNRKMKYDCSRTCCFLLTPFSLFLRRAAYLVSNGLSRSSTSWSPSANTLMAMAGYKPPF